MITYSEAKQILLSSKPELPKEIITLVSAQGRILAEDIYAKINSPAFTNSSVDGYAFSHRDAKKNLTLKVLGTIKASSLNPEAIPQYEENGCVQIMTGAMLPEWADTIVKVEETTNETSSITIKSNLPPLGANVRFAGSDLKAGQLVMRKGIHLKPEHVMILAAIGYREIAVEKKPKILLVTAGDELFEPGEPLEPGGIYNANKYFLLNALEALGLSPTDVLTLSDDPEKAAQAIRNYTHTEDPLLILSTGAVSMGATDFIPNLASDLGFIKRFHKVSIKPGKPAFFATRNHMAWLGLPGNPISVSVGWQIFARPLFKAWYALSEPKRSKVILKNEVRKPEDLRCFFRAEINQGKAWVSKRQQSHELAASISCDAYLELPEGIARFAPETTVDAIFL